MFRKDGQDPEEAVLEELGEVLQAIMKCRRFGYFNHDPGRSPYTENITALRYEMNDLNNAMVCLSDQLALREKLNGIANLEDAG